ncbi:MAG: hypothetical protein ACJA09_003402 [Alcanivorax sp.]
MVARDKKGRANVRSTGIQSPYKLVSALAGIIFCLSPLYSRSESFAPAPPADVRRAEFNFHGRLTLQTETPLLLEVFRDDYQFSANPALRMDQLPAFNFHYVQDGSHLVPLQRGAIPGEHPKTEYILEPGRIWQDSKQSFTRRISLPFSLQERSANCTHNGVLSFSIDRDGTPSPVNILIASETCMYYKFDLSGTLAATYQANESPHNDDVITAFRSRQAARLPTKPITELTNRYPGIELTQFAGGGRLPPEDITLFGFVVDGVHYRGDCQTRSGLFPFCDQLSLPSYSLAKTLHAGLAAMRLEKLYPGSMQALIAKHVPECRDSGNWKDVTFEHALNMVTGNYNSPLSHVDEDSDFTEEMFFSRSRHSDRISFSCNAWPRRAKPDSQWVYHSSDTYLLGTAMNALLKQQQGQDADIFDDLIMPLWQPMSLSPAVAIPMRSNDERAQPYADFGMTLLPDDIARLATALNQETFGPQLDSKMYHSAMQRLPGSRGHQHPDVPQFYYRNGFWAYDAQSLLACDEPVMVPFMSGYGGITVLMMPNDTVYYIFSDGGKFAFTGVLLQSHRIRSMCPEVD